MAQGITILKKIIIKKPQDYFGLNPAAILSAPFMPIMNRKAPNIPILLSLYSVELTQMKSLPERNILFVEMEPRLKEMLPDCHYLAHFSFLIVIFLLDMISRIRAA